MILAHKMLCSVVWSFSSVKAVLRGPLKSFDVIMFTIAWWIVCCYKNSFSFWHTNCQWNECIRPPLCLNINNEVTTHYASEGASWKVIHILFILNLAEKKTNTVYIKIMLLCLSPYHTRWPVSKDNLCQKASTRRQLFRWFKFALKPPYSITHSKLRLAIWDTFFWTFLVKFGHKGPWDIS